MGHPEKLLDLFDFIDTDQSGEVTETEFLEGICHLSLLDVPVETTQMLQMLRHHKRRLTEVRRDILAELANMKRILNTASDDKPNPAKKPENELVLSERFEM